jgi:predicted AAA+ superfamily ATPase
LLKDLPSLYGIGDTQELNRFFNVLAFNTGNELGPEALSKHSGITTAKLNDYLEYLEAAYLIRRVQRIDERAAPAARPQLQGLLDQPVHPCRPVRHGLGG